MADIAAESGSQPAPELVMAVAVWRQPVEALVRLGRVCPPEAFDRPTECPGWTVRAQFAHVIGLELDQLGEPDAPVDLPPVSHVRNGLGRRTEVSVYRRRDVAGSRLVAELENVIARRAAQLLDGLHHPDAPTMTAIGIEMPLLRALALRTFDCWTHEQDVRRALQRPGGLDSDAARVAVGWLRRSLPAVVARGARVRPGCCVVVQVDGPVAFTTAVRVEADDSGTARGIALHDEHAQAVVGAADVVLRLTTEAYTRRSCGRWTAQDTPAEITGDQAIAGAVIEALAVTP